MQRVSIKTTSLAASEGGILAGDARKNLEKQLGESVISKDNFLNIGDNPKNILPENNNTETE